VSAALGVLGLAYPFMVLAGLRYLPAWALPVLPMLLLAVRLALRRRGPTEAVLAASALAVLALNLVDPALALRSWPVLVSLGMAGLFAASLRWGPPMVERIARLAEPNLPDGARPYLRRLTAVWVGFLLFNATIAGWTVLYGSMEQWTLYNGFISYLLLGGLFAGEMLVRRFLRHKQPA
jgi:uncharacterized membrane protein